MELGTTAVTEAEIFYGIELLSKGRKREGLLAAAEAIAAASSSDVQARAVW